MMNTKDLREIFEALRSEARQRASDAMSDVTIGRRAHSRAPLWFGLGLVLGAIVGVVAALLSSPYSGDQARAKITERVERMRRQHESAETNGSPVATPMGTFERQAN